MGAVVKLPGRNPDGLRGATPVGELVKEGDERYRRFTIVGRRAYTEVWDWALVESSQLTRVQRRVWKRVPVESVTNATYMSMSADDQCEYLSHLHWALHRCATELSQWQARELQELTTGDRSDSYMAGWVAKRVRELEDNCAS